MFIKVLIATFFLHVHLLSTGIAQGACGTVALSVAADRQCVTDYGAKSQRVKRVKEGHRRQRTVRRPFWIDADRACFLSFLSSG